MKRIQSAAFALLVAACSSSEPKVSDRAVGGSSGANGTGGSLTAAGGMPTSAGSASTGGSWSSNAGASGSNTSGAAAAAGTDATGGSQIGGSGGAAAASTNGGAGAAARGGTSGASGSSAGAAGTVISVGIPKNPVLPGYNADPQIALFGSTFYIYPTTDGYANWTSPSFHAFSSVDLVHWKDEGVILDLGPDVSWADNRAWAPGIVFKNGVYYFYFSANGQIGVATASSPVGRFKDALGKPLITTAQYGGQSIDPYVFADDDGRSYLYFGSTSAGGHVVELNADMVSLKGTPQQIVIGGYKEGSVGFKRNGTYYFMYSEGDTRDADYDVAYGTGKSPMGPFTKAAVNPILKKNTALGILGPGHNSVLALPNGDYVIAYHRFAVPNGDGTHREVCIDRLEFNADGSIAPVVPTL